MIDIYNVIIWVIQVSGFERAGFLFESGFDSTATFEKMKGSDITNYLIFILISAKTGGEEKIKFVTTGEHKI